MAPAVAPGDTGASLPQRNTRFPLGTTVREVRAVEFDDRWIEHESSAAVCFYV